MTQFKLTGGARIGGTNVTWPFASLKVNRGRLDLNATLAGNLVFNSCDVISIVPYYSIPLIGQGIQINHRVENYNRKVIFWTLKDPKVVIGQIKQTGFLSNAYSENPTHESKMITEQQKLGGFPFRTSFVVGIVLIWNLLFFSDFYNYSQNEMVSSPLGNGAISALGVVLLTCVLLLYSEDFRGVALKKGRGVNHISKFVYFLMFVIGSMLMILLVLPK